MHTLIASLDALTLDLAKAVEAQDWQQTQALQKSRQSLLNEIATLSQSPDSQGLQQEDFDTLVAIRQQEETLKEALDQAALALKQERKSLTKGQAMRKAYGG
ncbi:MAG: flagellar protein FliT [Pontibacterium sp.]